MKVIERVTKDAINCEVKKYVCPKAKAITDGKRSYRDLSRMLMSHQEIICRDNKEVSKIFPWAHIAISNAKKMCLGIHHGINKMFMQNHLKEFCYKFNRRYFGDKLFHRLIIAAVDSPWYAFRLSHGWSIIKSIMVKNQFLLSATLFTIIFFSLTSHVNAQANIDIESGAVFTGYNNVKISGDAGTLFSLKTDLNAKPNAFIRIRAGYKIKSRHTISLLYAPLIVKSNGTTNKQIDFEGVTFPSNTSLNASYKFNSYRITYRYDIIKRSKFEFGLGFTAKIRDAEVALNSEGLTASKKNVGFVPIINFRLNWKINDKIGLLFDADALAAPQGRAEDVLFAGTYKFSEQFLVHLGYRILEGGADNSEVYNFALFHYASVGVTYTFKNKLKSN